MTSYGIPIEKETSIEWMLIPLFIMLISYALIRNSRERILLGTIRQFLFFNLNNQSFRDEGNQLVRASGFLMLNTFIGMSILIYKIIAEVAIGESTLIIYLAVLGLLLGVFVLKKGIMSIVKTITDSSVVIGYAKAYNTKYYESLGILLLPGLIALLFFPESSDLNFWMLGVEKQNIGLIYSLLLLAILYIIKLFQSLRQSFEVKVSWYYIILYLCTLEILPLVVLYRLLIGKIWAFN